MEETLKQEVETLRADLKQLRGDLLGLTKAIGQKTKAEAVEGLDSIKQAADQAKATLEDQVKERPLGTLLIAFAIGLLIGKSVSH